MISYMVRRDYYNRTLNLFCVTDALITSKSTGIVNKIKQMRRSVIDFLSGTAVKRHRASCSDCEQRVMNGALT